MHAFLVSVFAFVVLISFMVLVHELGHFIVAKLCGVRVERFSIGFPPRLFGIKIGDTDYCISATLAGGYVKMTGEDMPGENMSIQGADPDQIAAQKSDPGALTAHPRWQRILIGLAGPVANLILAFVLMFVYYAWINEVPSAQVNTTTIDWVVPNSPAAQAGIQAGDIIRRFDNVDNPDWDQVYAHSELNTNQSVQVTVNRGGQFLPFTLHVPPVPKGEDLDLSDEGILPQFLPGPIQVDEVEPDTPAERAGLRGGDAIEAVDGHAFHYVQTLLAYMRYGQGSPLDLTVLRNGQTLHLTANPTKLDADWKLGFVAVLPPYRDQPLAFGKAAGRALGFCKENSTLVLEVLKRLFTRRFSVSQLNGPVGIARMAGQATEMNGWEPKFDLGAEISLQLGMLNLLPFPILDGGMILFLLIESALRHDINLAIKERIYQAAFVVLMMFFVFIVFSDVTKLPIFTHVKP
jgi:regulator of sigma E protease